MADRLDSWKDIAQYIGRDVRTAQRWEDEGRLLVHREPGGLKPRVYALKREIDAALRASPPEPAGASIAVLPFANLTEDRETQYFGDGLADAVINALTRIPGLQVTARTSSFAFRGREQDVRELGARLNAATLLEGSIQRSGKGIRIAAQLVSAETGYHLWGDSYDRELGEIFAVEDEIACSIAEALRVRLTPQPLVAPATADLEAYALWLQGRHAMRELGADRFLTAQRCYQAALARDPAFALPYVDLAELAFDAAQIGFLPPAQAAAQATLAAERALSLDGTLGEAHSIVGGVRGVLQYDWEGARAAFERALLLAPGSADVLMRHAWFYLVPQRRTAEAIRELRLAVCRDPLSPHLHSVFGLAWLVARDYTRAAAEFRAGIELAPHSNPIHYFLGYTLIQMDKRDEGLAECLLPLRDQPPMPMTLGATALVYGMLGRRREAKRMQRDLAGMAGRVRVPPLAFAWASLGLGDDGVFEWLGKAIEARDPAVTHMASMPYYDAIKDDSRFAALLAKMGLRR